MKTTPHSLVKAMQLMASIPVKLVLKIFCRYEVSGLEHISSLTENEKKNGIIFVSNHISQLDSLVIPCVLPLLSSYLPIYFVALRREQYSRFSIGKYIYGGPLFSLFGAFVGSSGKGDYAQSLATHISLLRRGHSVLIYPEGKVTITETERTIRGGVAYLAEVSGAIIIPVTISGIAQTTWWQFLTMKRKVRVNFGQAFRLKTYRGEQQDYHAQAKEIMDHIVF